MTVTANGQATTASPITRYMVNCRRTDLPMRRRTETGKILAVRRATGDWVGFFPNPTNGVEAADQWGWRIPTHLSAIEIERLGIQDLVDTHRGWYIQMVTDTEAIAISPDLVPPTYDELVAEVARLKKEHEDFIDRASDILGSEANDHDLCETYDNIAERAGLRRRPRSHDVEIEVTYRQTVSMVATSWEKACQDVAANASNLTRHFSPGSPFQTSDIEEYGTCYSLKVTVPDLAVEVF